MPGYGPPPTPAKKLPRKTLIGVIGAAAALIVTPFVSGWESGGTPRLVAYQDIVKVWTICGGETLAVKPGMVETVAGCELREEAALIRHAQPVLACTPILRSHPNQLSAAISLAYNIGTGGYCGSTVARRFNASNWRGACDAFLMWNKAGACSAGVRGGDRRSPSNRRHPLHPPRPAMRSFGRCPLTPKLGATVAQLGHDRPR